jgi:hypothetical protein
MFNYLSQSCQEIRRPHRDTVAKTSKPTPFFVFYEHQWAFLAPIWHKTCGSQILFVTISYKIIRQTWGNSGESSETVNRRRSQTTLSTCCPRSSVTRDGLPWLPTSCTSVLPSQNFLHHYLTHLSLIKFGPYTAHILWWISAALWPSACKKQITAHSSTHVNMPIAQWELNAMIGRVVSEKAIVYRSVLCQCQVAIFTGLPTLAHRTLISENALYYIKLYC